MVQGITVIQGITGDREIQGADQSTLKKENLWTLKKYMTLILKILLE